MPWSLPVTIWLQSCVNEIWRHLLVFVVATGYVRTLAPVPRQNNIAPSTGLSMQNTLPRVFTSASPLESSQNKILSTRRWLASHHTTSLHCMFDFAIACAYSMADSEMSAPEHPEATSYAHFSVVQPKYQNIMILTTEGPKHNGSWNVVTNCNWKHCAVSPSCQLRIVEQQRCDYR